MSYHILLISQSFMGIPESLVKALKIEGFIVDSYIYKTEKKKTVDRVISSLMKDSDWYADKIEQRKVTIISEEVEKRISKYKYDYVIDYLGSNLQVSTIAKIKKKSKIIKMMGDTIKYYPYLIKTIAQYDVVSTYEPSDIQALRRYGAQRVELVLSNYDDTIYFRKDFFERDIDICFVGKSFTKEHTNRRETLEHVVKVFGDCKFAIYGVYAKPYNYARYLKWSFIDRGKYFKNVNIVGNEVNDLYNRSKICLNINSFQTVGSWSSRLVEIMGSGAFALSQRTPLNYSHFKDKIGFYNNYADLDDAIQYWLTHDEEREQIAYEGYQYAKTNYSICAYADKVLHILKSLE